MIARLNRGMPHCSVSVSNKTFVSEPIAARRNIVFTMDMSTGRPESERGTSHSSAIVETSDIPIVKIEYSENEEVKNKNERISKTLKLTEIKSEEDYEIDIYGSSSEFCKTDSRLVTKVEKTNLSGYFIDPIDNETNASIRERYDPPAEKRHSLVCHLCLETFENEKNVKIHLLKKHRPSYRCRLCRSTYHDKLELDEHTKIHESSVYLECSLCQMRFKRLPGLRQHRLRVHATGEPKFICDHCGNRYRLKIDLVLHINRHHLEEPRDCRYCGKFVKSMSKHEWRHHTRLNNVTFDHSCGICGKKFRTEYKLVNHMLKHEKGCYTCEICELEFSGPRKLVYHKRSAHKHGVTSTCPICQKIFASKSNFYQHVLTHSGTRPYKCAICDYTFVQRSTLIRHRKIHPGTLPPIEKLTPVADRAKKFLLTIFKAK